MALQFDAQQVSPIFACMKLTPRWSLAVLVLALLTALVPSLRGADSLLGAAAPELVQGTWLNLPTATGLTLAARKGKVTIVHFWTYGCINCRRNLPIYDRWHQRYATNGVLVIGIHTPETEAERKPANVARKVKDLGLAYPVLLDARNYNWNRWRQNVWPAVYIVDKQGRIRCMAEGELEYKDVGGEAKVTKLIEALLKE